MLKLKMLICAVLTLSAISLLSGCNTVAGFGKDMQQGGKDLQQAASDNK